MYAIQVAITFTRVPVLHTFDTCKHRCRASRSGFNYVPYNAPAYQMLAQSANIRSWVILTI